MRRKERTEENVPIPVVKALSLALVAAAALPAAAQNYPTRVLRYVVTESPGSGLDALARIVARRR